MRKVGSAMTTGLTEHNIDQLIRVIGRVVGKYSLNGSKQAYGIRKARTEAVELNKMTVYASRRMDAALERRAASCAVQNP